MTQLIIHLGRGDRLALEALLLRRRRALDRLMVLLTHLGGATAAMTAAMLLVAGAVPGLADAGACAVFTLVASHLGVQALKRVVHRPRPTLPVGIEALAAAPDRFSFPSGHAAAALSVALPVAAALPPSGAVLGVAAAALVGVTRCYLGVHYPGDVVAGWALALVGYWLAPAALGLLGLT